MEIKGKNMLYKVVEHKNEWVLKSKENGVNFEYKVSKSDCKTIEELKQFLKDSDVI